MALSIVRSEPDVSGSWKEFDDRLAETARWCAAHARPLERRKGLWTTELAPSPQQTDRFAACRVVAERRRTEGRAYAEVDAASGRLLAYFPDADLSDGAAEVQSGGFFDVCNSPPWDSWVALVEDSGGELYYRTYLVAWVPAPLIPFVQEGIDVNPEECIRWLDDTHTALATRLRERGGAHAPEIDPPDPPEDVPPRRGWRFPFFRNRG